MKLLIAIVLAVCACGADHDNGLPYPVLPNVGSHAVAGVQQGTTPDAAVPDAGPVIDAGVPRPDLLTMADASPPPSP